MSTTNVRRRNFQYLKLGVAQMDGKIWKRGKGGGGYLFYTVPIIHLRYSFMVPCYKVKYIDTRYKEHICTHS